MGIAGDETTPKFSKAGIGFLFATVAKDSRTVPSALEPCALGRLFSRFHQRCKRAHPA